MKYDFLIFCFIFLLVIVGLYHNTDKPTYEELTLDDLRSCSYTSITQWNKTYLGEFGRYHTRCGWETVCNSRCRYLDDHCRTESFCNRIRPTGGGGSSTADDDSYSSFSDSDTSRFCEGDGEGIDYCRGYEDGKGW